MANVIKISHDYEKMSWLLASNRTLWILMGLCPENWSQQNPWSTGGLPGQCYILLSAIIHPQLWKRKKEKHTHKKQKNKVNIKTLLFHKTVQFSNVQLTLTTALYMCVSTEDIWQLYINYIYICKSYIYVNYMSNIYVNYKYICQRYMSTL